MNSRGLLITFEGPDGAGKTTQIQSAVCYIESMGRHIIQTREPGGTPIGEKIRELVLDANNTGMNPITEALLFSASRAQHVADVIIPALDRGDVIICDRYIDSSLAYQGYGRQLGEDQVMLINRLALKGALPDLTICILVTPKDAMKRMTARGHGQLDRLEQEELLFKQRVYEGYATLAKKEPERILLLDAMDSVENIGKAIQKKLSKLLRC